MDRDEVLRLMADLESDRVERTVSLSNTDKFTQAICAFANDMPHHRQPGYPLLGVKDGRGIAIAQAELQRNGSPEARFELGANHFLSIVPRRA